MTPITHSTTQEVTFSLLQGVRLLLLFTLLLSTPQLLFADEKIRLTNGEWPPYLSQKLPHHGAASHIVREAFANEGIEVEYGFFPWNRSYILAQRGVWDGTVVWVKTPEREQNFLYSDVVITDTEYLFHLKSVPLHFTDMASLTGKKVGATLHTAYPTLERAQEDGLLQIERYGNYNLLYRRLLNKRVDAIPHVKQVGKYFQRTSLSEAEQQQITHSPLVLQTRQYHLILNRVSPRNVELLKRFNKGLRQLRENGRYQAILAALEDGHYDPPETRRTGP